MRQQQCLLSEQCPGPLASSPGPPKLETSHLPVGHVLFRRNPASLQVTSGEARRGRSDDLHERHSNGIPHPPFYQPGLKQNNADPPLHRLSRHPPPVSCAAIQPLTGNVHAVQCVALARAFYRTPRLGKPSQEQCRLARAPMYSPSPACGGGAQWCGGECPGRHHTQPL